MTAWNESISFGRRRTEVEVTLVSGLYHLGKDGEYEECSKEHSQFTAVTQWSLRFPEVLILADDWSVCAAALQIGKTTDGNIKCHQHTCMHAEYGRPVVPCLLHDAFELATTDYVLFTNSDLAYLNVVPAVTIAQAMFEESFALLGRRRDIDFQHECKMKTKDIAMLDQILDAPGELHDPFGIDYIVLPRNTIASVIKDMPDFLIGLWKWDNWLVDTCIHKGINLVDATNVLHAIHLQSTKEDHRGRKGYGHNKDLYSKFYKLEPGRHLLDDPFPVGLGTIDYAPFYIKDQEVLRRWCYFDVGKEFQSCRNRPLREDITSR
ncbi:hypothetical protein M9434_007216 [Picochlorum sp. BPE23]|nr:hypothetical protein M9434_007216 [Picochlorum sp. BPE23]